MKEFYVIVKMKYKNCRGKKTAKYNVYQGNNKFKKEGYKNAVKFDYNMDAGLFALAKMEQLSHYKEYPNEDFGWVKVYYKNGKYKAENIYSSAVAFLNTNEVVRRERIACMIKSNLESPKTKNYTNEIYNSLMNIMTYFFVDNTLLKSD